MQVGEHIAPNIELASATIVSALLNEKKVMICGNGVSSLIGQTFASALIDRFERERPGLPAIWLGSNGSAYHCMTEELSPADAYAKPIRTLGQNGDILVVISLRGHDSNLIQSIGAAHDRDMTVIALTGQSDGDISAVLDVNDIEICAQLDSWSRVHEIHLLTIFCLCDLIDHQLFGME